MKPERVNIYHQWTPWDWSSIFPAGGLSNHRTREFCCHFMPWFFGLLLVPGSNKKADFLRFAAPGIWRMVIPRWIFGGFLGWMARWHRRKTNLSSRCAAQIQLAKSAVVFFLCVCLEGSACAHARTLWLLSSLWPSHVSAWDWWADVVANPLTSCGPRYQLSVLSKLDFYGRLFIPLKKASFK